MAGVFLARRQLNQTSGSLEANSSGVPPGPQPLNELTLRLHTRAFPTTRSVS